MVKGRKVKAKTVIIEEKVDPPRRSNRSRSEDENGAQKSPKKSPKGRGKLATKKVMTSPRKVGRKRGKRRVATPEKTTVNTTAVFEEDDNVVTMEAATMNTDFFSDEELESEVEVSSQNNDAAVSMSQRSRESEVEEGEQCSVHDSDQDGADASALRS